MTQSSSPRRAVATAAVLLGLLVGTTAMPALAGIAGQATGSQAASSATFGIIPTTLPGTPPPGALNLTYAAILAPPDQYFDAVNVGSLALTAANYSVAVSGGGALGAPSISLTACTAGTWNQSTGVCSGTSTALGTWTASAATPASSTAIPTSPASRLGIKATLSAGGVLSAVTTATVTIGVASNGPRQIRAATTSNS